MQDFPDDASSQRKGLIFVHWVRLCAIMGRIAKKSMGTETSSWHSEAHSELLDWIQSLPKDIQLRLDSHDAATFDQDIYQLHLPYLTAVIILHLRRSSSDLPQALPPAILAASCTSKILRNILARGNARFLMAITCWYSGMAFIALLQGSRIPQFAKEAEEGIAVLISAVEQLQKMWPTANVIRQGFDRMRKENPANGRQPGPSNGYELRTLNGEETQGAEQGDPPAWKALLPFVNPSTDKMAECMLRNQQAGSVTHGMPSPTNTLFYDNVMQEYQDFLDPLLVDPQTDLIDISQFQV